MLCVGRRGFQRHINLGVSGLRHTAELYTQLSPTAAYLPIQKILSLLKHEPKALIFRKLVGKAVGGIKKGK